MANNHHHLLQNDQKVAVVTLASGAGNSIITGTVIEVNSILFNQHGKNEKVFPYVLIEDPEKGKIMVPLSSIAFVREMK